MILLRAVAVLLMFSASALADTDKPLPQTATEAAVYALKLAYDNHPHYYEYGGVIIHTPKGYNPSTPVTDGAADHMDINEDPEHYEGDFPVVADYHTHPCMEGYLPGVFSPTDLRTMREDQRPGYLLDECTGDVHYWEPGMGYDKPDTDDIPETFRRRMRTATGQIVGHIAVDGKRLSL